MKKSLLLIAIVLTTGLIGCQAVEKVVMKNQKKTSFSGMYVVDTKYVKANIGNEEVIMVDARGEAAAKEGTVKNAIVLDWQYLSDCEGKNPGDENWGCILPKKELSKRLSQIGLSQMKEIIVFSTIEGGWGDDGRIVWELIAAGYQNVKIVDGGFKALEAAGIETQKGSSPERTAEVNIREIDKTDIISSDELIQSYSKYKIIDARSKEEYEAGHLSDAINISHTELFRADSTLKSNGEILNILEAHGLTFDEPIVIYCTAGVRSAYMQLIMEMCGFKSVKNYDESYNRWVEIEEVEY